jgi:lysyl-tRNA synthetase class 2
MKALPKETQILRSRFLHLTRSFLTSQDFLEVDTPIFKPIVGMEPYLDPFLVTSPSRKENGFLITSPEYSLKQSLSMGLERIYEITHTFRSGEKDSPIHTSEFLMLELYARDFDDKRLMSFVQSYFEFLFQNFSNNPNLDTAKGDKFFRYISVKQAFIDATGKGYERSDLLRAIQSGSLTNTPPSELYEWRYEDLFFLVFLNYVEPNLGEGIVFLYDYPPECSALARIVEGVAKRFEIYWDGVELANAFWELKDASEQRGRFIQEQELRGQLGKQVFEIDEDFMQSLESQAFPDAAGISLGLDRIFMKLLGLSQLSSLSPYFE